MLRKKVIGKPAAEDSKKSEDASPSKPTLKMGGIKRLGGPMGGGLKGGLKMGGLKGLGGGSPLKKQKTEEKEETKESKKDEDENEAEQEKPADAQSKDGENESTKDEQEQKSTNKTSKAATKAKMKATQGSKDNTEEDASHGDNLDKPKKSKEKKETAKPAAKAPAKPVGGIGGGKKQEVQKVPFNQEEAENHIAEFMEKNNRPYGVQDILNNFQGRLKKPLCQKVMDELAESKIFSLKEYGKAKVYLINQDLFDTATDEQLLILDEQIKVRKDEFYELSNQGKQLVAQFKEANLGMTNKSLEEQIAQIKKDIEEIEGKLKPFQESGAKLITQDELNEAEAKLKKGREEWKRRRKGCESSAANFSEGANMSKKAFMEDLGIETDEENKVVNPLW